MSDIRLLCWLYGNSTVIKKYIFEQQNHHKLHKLLMAVMKLLLGKTRLVVAGWYDNKLSLPYIPNLDENFAPTQKA